MTLSTLDANTALVLIDLQVGTVARPTVPHPADQVVARGRELADAFRRHQLPVVLVNVVDGAPGRTELDLIAAREAEAAGEAAEQDTEDEDEGPDDWADIVAELGVEPADLRVSKRTWGAFHETDLDALLRRRGVTQVVLGGLMTSIGVETTAREAYAHGYHVTLAADATADWTAEAHERSVSLVFPRLGERGTAAEIVELLDRTR